MLDFVNHHLGSSQVRVYFKYSLIYKSQKWNAAIYSRFTLKRKYRSEIAASVKSLPAQIRLEFNDIYAWSRSYANLMLYYIMYIRVYSISRVHDEGAWCWCLDLGETIN